jgi:hypothetical protein
MMTKPAISNALTGREVALAKFNNYSKTPVRDGDRDALAAVYNRGERAMPSAIDSTVSPRAPGSATVAKREAPFRMLDRVRRES